MLLSMQFESWCEMTTKKETAITELWECLGRWSAYLVSNGEQANLSPPEWLRDAVKNATAPSIGEPVLYAVQDWNAIANHPSTKGGTICSIVKTDLHDVPLFTEPQPDRVAELESTIKSYNEFLASGEPENYRAKISALEAKLKEYDAEAKRYRYLRHGGKFCGGEIIVYGYAPNELDEAIDQAMKG